MSLSLNLTPPQLYPTETTRPSLLRALGAPTTRTPKFYAASLISATRRLGGELIFSTHSPFLRDSAVSMPLRLTPPQLYPIETPRPPLLRALRAPTTRTPKFYPALSSATRRLGGELIFSAISPCLRDSAVSLAELL